MNRLIDLVLADVDGTLVTNEKVLTEDAKRAVQDLHEAGIRFAITSGRPPRGMAMVSGALRLDTPVAGFNGGVLMAPDMESVLNSYDLPQEVVQTALDLLGQNGLDAWVYTKKRWLVLDGSAPHVAREAHTVQFEPEIVARFAAEDLQSVVKIVGVTDDRAKMQAALRAATDEFGERVSAACSQPYYLDITNAKANKGAVVDELSQRLEIPRERIATIGDMPNDVAMFKRSGMSIAMGNADNAVKASARFTTDSNENDGFAKAIRKFVLGAGA